MGQENDVPPEWKDRVLYVYLRGGGGESLQTGIALSNASFTRIKDQLFLSGRALSDPSDWVAELPLLILWEEIVHLVILSSAQDYFDRMSRARRGLIAHQPDDPVS